MKKIAITGNIGAGKSSVEKILESKGFSVIDADKVVKELQTKDFVVKKLNEITGLNVWDYTLPESRKMLAAKIFGNKVLKAKVENFLHPLVKDELLKFANEHARESIVFLSVPLLFEAGFTDIADEILFVDADENIRKERLLKSRDMSENEVARRIKSQMRSKEKISKSDYAIKNNGTIDELHKQVEKFLKSVKILPKIEILSPAKDKQTAFCAINSGADAVYIGSSAFGARQNASNSLEDIKEVVDYAHKFGVKIYVTVNTVLTDDELEKAVKLVKKLDEINVDAVIIQDMGLFERIIREKIKIPVHISTQCDNYLPEKVKFFEDCGVERVVLARELSLEQIREIRKKCSKVELEAFIHGALCVSYSGRCYLSLVNGKRSANRGCCAQPCRKKYDVIDEKGNIVTKGIHALCLKDFNASEHFEELSKAGILSFKIEGRLKDESYVTNVTAFYAKKAEKFAQKTSSGKVFLNFEPHLEKSFNRGFTDYFLEGRKDCHNFVSPKSQGEYLGKIQNVGGNFFNLKTNKTVHSGDGLCFVENGELKGFLVNKAEGNKIFPNTKVFLVPGMKIFRNSDVEFKKNMKSERKIGISVKAGKTVEITDEDGFSVKAEINSDEKPVNFEKYAETFEKQFSKTGETIFYVCGENYLPLTPNPLPQGEKEPVSTVTLSRKGQNFKTEQDIPFLPVSRINALRRKMLEELEEKRLKGYKRNNSGELKHAQYFKNTAGYEANVLNETAKEFYLQCGCEIKEYAPEKKLPKENFELMRTKYCLWHALGFCVKNGKTKNSPQKLFIVDEKGKKYEVVRDCKACENIILFG